MLSEIAPERQFDPWGAAAPQTPAPAGRREWVWGVATPKDKALAQDS